MRKSTEIKKELEENKELLKAEGIMADEKAFIEDEIKDLEAELEKALESEKSSGTAKPKAPAKKKTTARKTRTRKAAPKKTTSKRTPARKPKAPAEKKYIMFEGKKIYEDDANYCEKLVKAWEERKAARKRADGKRKTKPVTQRVAANVAQAITKGVRSLSSEDIKKNPNKAVSDIERLEKAGMEFLDAFKNILGEKITQKEIKEEFDGIDKMIAEIKRKYIDSSKKKFENGGEIKRISDIKKIFGKSVTEVEKTDEGNYIVEGNLKEIQSIADKKGINTEPIENWGILIWTETKFKNGGEVDVVKIEELNNNVLFYLPNSDSELVYITLFKDENGEYVATKIEDINSSKKSLIKLTKGTIVQPLAPVFQDNSIYKMGKGGQISESDYATVVNHWVYFTFNYPYNFLDKTFGTGAIANHIKEKFNNLYDKYGSKSVMPKFFNYLDNENRMLLCDFSKNNYVNSEKEFEKLKNISDEDYCKIVNHWTKFGSNYNSGFIDDVFKQNTGHYQSKFNTAYEKAGAEGVVNYFYIELSSDNQSKLANWVMKNYSGTKFEEGGDVEVIEDGSKVMYLRKNYGYKGGYGDKIIVSSIDEKLGVYFGKPYDNSKVPNYLKTQTFEYEINDLFAIHPNPKS